MTTRTYNTFYSGIKEDDFLTAGPNFIEGYNITGLFNGYGLTLGPKMNKQLLTNTAPRTIFGIERTDQLLTDIAVGCDGGEVYKLSSNDNTPIYTRTDAFDIVNGALLLKGSNYMYFACKNPNPNIVTVYLMRVSFTDFLNETFTSVNETFLNIASINTPPMLLDGEFLYVGGLNTVYRIDGAGSVTTHAIFNRYVTGITKEGTQFKVFTNEGGVVYWDGVSSSITASISLNFRISRMISSLGIDHIIAQDGSYIQGSGYSYSEPIIKPIKSSRLNDNSQYIDKFNFRVNYNTGQSIIAVKGGVSIISKDTKPGIYISEKLIQGLPKGFHKHITRDNTDTEFDEIFTQTYLSKGQNKIFFGYQSGTTKYGVDYIDLESKETAKYGYAITDVFSGGTAFEKEIEVIRFAQSYNGDVNNYIKLYKRINNGVWEEIGLTKPSDNIITRENITDEKGEWIDIQFKIEFYNDTQSEFPPVLHELSHDYSITKY